MKVVFYLKSCNTCTRIIKELELSNAFIFREIKSTPITIEELELTVRSKIMNLFSIKELNYLVKINKR